MATSLAATAAGTALEDLPEDTLLAILARRRRRLLRLPSPRRRRVLPGSPARPRAPLRPPSPAPSPPLSHRCAPPPPLPPPPPSPPRPLAPPLLLPPRRLPWTPLPRRVRVGPACHARRLPPLFAPSPRLPIHPEWRPMAGEGEDEAAAIELQLEQHLQEQRSSLAAVDEALAADPSNADLLEVHEELLAAIKDAEEGLLHLKRSRLVKQIDEIFPNQESTSQAPEVAVEPLQPDDIEPEGPEPLEQQEFSVGSKCRFRHKDGRWYNGCIIGLEGSRDARISFLTPTSENMSMCRFFLQQRCRFGSNCRLSHGTVTPTSSLKRFTPTRWQQSLVGSSILAASGHHSGLWRRAELESWDDDLKLGQVVFQDDGSSARLPSESLSISEYAGISNEDDEGSLSEEESEFSEDGDQEDESIHQGLGLLESTNFSGVQSETAIFAKWENHTRGVASKMMAKMGYREGMGLGVSGQGMLDPIPVKVLPPKQSLDHAVAASTDDGTIGRGKRRSRGGKRKREKKFADQARAAKAEEAERSVFSFINSQLVGQDVAEGSDTKVRKESSGEANGHAKKEDRRSLVAYDDEVKELRSRVEKLEEMMKRNRKDKAVYEAAARKLEQTRKALADAEATHASAINAVARKEKEKKWLKF